MKEVKHNGHTFLIYDSITEFPVENFFKFNLNVALQAGIGGDMNSVMARNKELREWIRRGRKKDAMQALSNMENTIMAIMSGIDPESNAFVCCVHSCDGVPVDDLSQEGMTRCLKQWSKKGLTIGKVKEWLEEVKKNSTLKRNNTSRTLGIHPW